MGISHNLRINHYDLCWPYIMIEHDILTIGIKFAYKSITRNIIIECVGFIQQSFDIEMCKHTY